MLRTAVVDGDGTHPYTIVRTSRSACGGAGTEVATRTGGHAGSARLPLGDGFEPWRRPCQLSCG